MRLFLRVAREAVMTFPDRLVAWLDRLAADLREINRR